MTTQQHNITIGTAGHIDHGKTALVKLLTGCETDRLKIEKERGMSIELGFAPCVIADLEVGIVDVPGHENFVKTMVAGASGIDGCILVVAADDGVMPQTREHLDILTLLGVRARDRGPDQGRCGARRSGRRRPRRRSGNSSPARSCRMPRSCPISNITGQGFEEFYEALKAMVAAITPKTADGIFRVPVERAFSAKGYGTIVAGIPACGSVGIGDEVELLPQRTKGRVRSVQVYGRDSTRAMAGQCAAINIPQWDHKDIERGNVITHQRLLRPAPVVPVRAQAAGLREGGPQERGPGQVPHRHLRDDRQRLPLPGRQSQARPAVPDPGLSERSRRRRAARPLHPQIAVAHPHARRRHRRRGHRETPQTHPSRAFSRRSPSGPRPWPSRRTSSSTA